MEKLEITVFSFDELNDEAKERARNWWRSDLDYPWFSESIDSIREFVAQFGGEVTDWAMGERYRSYIKTTVTPANFRGKRLKNFPREVMPTGFYLDSVLSEAFYDEWERTGDPMYAFEQALETALLTVASDIEHQSTDEAVDECLAINSYKFFQDGRVYE